jgi:hypothetical protein
MGSLERRACLNIQKGNQRISQSFHFFRLPANRLAASHPSKNSVIEPAQRLAAPDVARLNIIHTGNQRFERLLRTNLIFYQVFKNQVSAEMLEKIQVEKSRNQVCDVAMSGAQSRNGDKPVLRQPATFHIGSRAKRPSGPSFGGAPHAHR